MSGFPVLGVVRERNFNVPARVRAVLETSVLVRVRNCVISRSITRCMIFFGPREEVNRAGGVHLCFPRCREGWRVKCPVFLSFLSFGMSVLSDPFLCFRCFKWNSPGPRISKLRGVGRAVVAAVLFPANMLYMTRIEAHLRHAMKRRLRSFQ